MLPGHARMRRSEDFRRTVRRGVRAGRRTLVVHALRLPGDSAEGPSGTAAGPVVTPGGGAVGFVVSRAVGSAVTRNRVKRRLRHLARAHVEELDGRSDQGGPTLVVVRALPPAAAAGPELGSDLDAAWASALSRLAQR